MTQVSYWKELINNESYEANDVVKHLSEHGIPEECRMDVWKWATKDLIEQIQKESDESYTELKTKHEELSKDIINDVKADLEKLEESNKDKVNEILLAYNIRKPNSYYTGQNYLVNYLYSVMKDENDTFWLFTALMEKVLIHNAEFDIYGYNTDIRILDSFAAEQLQKLKSHLEDVESKLCELVCSSYVSVFTYKVPVEVSHIILDFLLCSIKISVYTECAPDIVLMGSALCLLKEFENKLSKKDKMKSMIECLYDGIEEMKIDEFRSKLIPLCLSIKKSRFEAFREKHAVTLRGEYDQLNRSLWSGNTINFGENSLGITLGIDQGNCIVSRFKRNSDGSPGLCERSGLVGIKSVIVSLNGKDLKSNLTLKEVVKKIKKAERPLNVTFQTANAVAHKRASSHDKNVSYVKDNYYPEYLYDKESIDVVEECTYLSISERNSFNTVNETLVSGQMFISNYRIIFHTYPTATSALKKAQSMRNILEKAPLSPSTETTTTAGTTDKPSENVNEEVNAENAEPVSNVDDLSEIKTTPTPPNAASLRRASSFNGIDIDDLNNSNTAAVPSLQPVQQSNSNPSEDNNNDIQIPLLMIHNYEDIPPYTIRIRTKTYQFYEFSYRKSKAVNNVTKYIDKKAFPKNSIKNTFAFREGSKDSYKDSEIDGWAIYDAGLDYDRLGLLNCPKLRFVVQGYDISPSYPMRFLTSASINDRELEQICKYRSSNRIPVPVWRHPVTNAILCRSAQPNTGLQNKRSSSDEKLLPLLASCCECRKDKYYVVDARSQIAAFGNRSMGKGTENPAFYPGMNMYFMNIANIHGARESLYKMMDLYYNKQVRGDDETFTKRLNDAGWLQQVRSVICSLTRCVEILEDEGCSVFSHCSDGWDRTSQMVCGTELLLDPYYRTIRGFCEVLEKEWCSFGHNFARRHGMNNGDFNDSKRSPVFLLFMDVLYQILYQYPCAFEFNNKLLLFLADNVYSGRFGTFMFNSERERVENEAATHSVSIWTHILDDKNINEFRNEKYVRTEESLRPSCHMRHMRLWEEYFCRSDVDYLPEMKSKYYY